jgi:hypothetical protein
MNIFWQAIFIINGLCIAGLLGTFIWAGFALGRHEEFQARMSVCFVLQAPCLIFIGIRRMRRKGHGG